MKLYFLFTALLFRQSQGPKLIYPDVWRDETFKENIHGIYIYDPYRWLEDLDSPKVQNFVKEQNAITNPYLNSGTDRENIKESLNRMEDYNVFDPPVKKGKWYFTLVNRNALDIHVGLFNDHERLIYPSPDQNVVMARFYPSEDGEIVAYGRRANGSDWFSVHFINVSTGQDLPDKLTQTKFTSLCWTHDNRGIFYSRYPRLKNQNVSNTLELRQDINQKMYYHILGTKQSEDILVVEFPENPDWSTGCAVSDDGKYLIVSIEESLGPTQLHYIDLISFIHSNYQPKPMLNPIVTNFNSEYYYITNDESVFIFRTNLNAPNYRLVGIDIHKPEEKHWNHNLLLEDPNHVLSWACAIDGDKLVVNYIKDVQASLQIRTIDGQRVIKDYPPNPGSIVSIAGSKKDSNFFYKVESFLSPGIIYRIDFENTTYQPIVYDETVIPGFNGSEYIVDQKFYKGKDGTRIPMFLVHKKDLKLGPDTPILLFGYGGFNTINAPSFSSENLVFAKNLNGVFVSANIRGGGEYGEKWYNAGRKLKKQNVFDDFEYAAKYLINNNYTSSAKLTIRGISNGGLLVAACVNQHPELYGAAVAQVGVMDMLRFQKFTIGSAWTSDYGFVEDEVDFKYLLSYSPLHNVRMPEDKRIQYPSMLLVASDHDDRVAPSHSFKLISELQHVIGRNPRQRNHLLIRINTGVGHGGGMPMIKQIEIWADILAFIQKSLDLKFEE